MPYHDPPYDNAEYYDDHDDEFDEILERMEGDDELGAIRSELATFRTDDDLVGSVLTCNYCDFHAIRRQAEKEGMKVTLISGPVRFGTSGVDVYVHPPDINVRELEGMEQHEYWRIWFAELPTSCFCDSDNSMLTPGLAI
ncbi:MAG: hypothetical protein NWE79_00775 [Candidatus Bathyarchaeota archaeon]|nr:hypothetical protein [Candidatus Bathyarchaeota archaeon]